jgi:DNA-binding NtrC family response regulator
MKQVQGCSGATTALFACAILNGQSVQHYVKVKTLGTSNDQLGDSVGRGSEDLISNDLVARSDQDLFDPEISLDGPISLKKLTRQATRELERKIILKVLQAHRWNRKQAARMLCISYRGLLYKMDDVGLSANTKSHHWEDRSTAS